MQICNCNAPRKLKFDIVSQTIEKVRQAEINIYNLASFQMSF